jgi:hypothetical protein
VAPVGVGLGEPGRGAGVRRIVRLDAAVKIFRGLELPGAAQRLRLCEPLRGQEIAQAEVLAAHLLVGGIVFVRFLQQRQRFFPAALVEELARIVERPARGRARGEDEANAQSGDSGPDSVHGFLCSAGGRT